MAWQEDYKQAILELDSTTTITLIQKGVDWKHLYGLVVAHIHELFCHDWLVHLCHIYKEANRAANYLVEIGPSLNLGVCFYLSPLSRLGGISQDDLAGVAMPRLTI